MTVPYWHGPMKRFAAFSFLLCYSLLGHAATLALKGSVGYSHMVTSVIVAADNVSNTGATPSGQVRLELWATPAPYTGSFTGGYQLAQYPIGSIAAGASVLDISSPLLPWTNPPAGTWYVAMVVRHGTAYLESFVVGDNLERFTTTRFNESRPIWFYLPVIAGGLMPWSAFAVGAAAAGLASLARRQWSPSRDDLRLVFWAVVPTLFFMASVGQQPRYVLPVLPPLAILTARAIGERIEAARAEPRTALLASATWATAATLVLCAGLLYRLQPLLVATPPAILATSVIGIAAGGAALAIVALRRAWAALPLAAAAAAVTLLLGLQFSVLAPGRPDAVERMAASVAAHRTAGQPLGSLHAFTRNLIFYTGLRQLDLVDVPGAARFLAQDGSVLVVLLERDLAAVASALPTPPRVLARVRHLNTATLRLRSVLDPDPDKELETVVLATNR